MDNTDLDQLDAFDMPEDVIAQRGAWTLRCTEEARLDFGAWKKCFTSLFVTAVDQIQEKWPLPNGIEGHVILSGPQANLDWGVEEESMGFHALGATVNIDNNLEYVIPEDHRCYINLQAHQLLLDGDEDDIHSRLACLITLPHEMAHVALFSRHTEGKTPLEGFDEWGSIDCFEEINDEISNSLPQSTSQHGPHEDMVENFGSSVVDLWYKNPSSAQMLSNIAQTKKVPTRKIKY